MFFFQDLHAVGVVFHAFFPLKLKYNTCGKHWYCVKLRIVMCIVLTYVISYEQLCMGNTMTDVLPCYPAIVLSCYHAIMLSCYPAMMLSCYRADGKS